MARGELFRAVPGAAFRRLRWAGLDHAKVVKPAYPVYNTEAGEGALRPLRIPRLSCRLNRRRDHSILGGFGGASVSGTLRPGRRQRRSVDD